MSPNGASTNIPSSLPREAASDACSAMPKHLPPNQSSSRRKRFRLATVPTQDAFGQFKISTFAKMYRGPSTVLLNAPHDPSALSLATAARSVTSCSSCPDLLTLHPLAECPNRFRPERVASFLAECAIHRLLQRARSEKTPLHQPLQPTMLSTTGTHWVY